MIDSSFAAKEFSAACATLYRHLEHEKGDDKTVGLYSQQNWKVS
jgi:hypothetical protein